MKDLSIDQLKEILLTCDGKGKDIKSQVLDELLRRATEPRILVMNNLEGAALLTEALRKHSGKVYTIKNEDVKDIQQYIPIEKEKEWWRKGNPKR